MFRITCVNSLGIYHIHKKFLWFWVKWNHGKLNWCMGIDGVKYIINNGYYDFFDTDKSSYFYLIDVHNNFDVHVYYVYNYQQFVDFAAEYLI